MNSASNGRPREDSSSRLQRQVDIEIERLASAMPAFADDVRRHAHCARRAFRIAVVAILILGLVVFVQGFRAAGAGADLTGWAFMLGAHLIVSYVVLDSLATISARRDEAVMLAPAEGHRLKLVEIAMSDDARVAEIVNRWMDHVGPLRVVDAQELSKVQDLLMQLRHARRIAQERSAEQHAFSAAVRSASSAETP